MVELTGLMNFTSMARDSAHQTYGLHSMLLDSRFEFQAWCMQRLWHGVLSRPGGSDLFVAW